MMGFWVSLLFFPHSWELPNYGIAKRLPGHYLGSPELSCSFLRALFFSSVMPVYTELFLPPTDADNSVYQC